MLFNVEPEKVNALLLKILLLPTRVISSVAFPSTGIVIVVPFQYRPEH